MFLNFLKKTVAFYFGVPLIARILTSFIIGTALGVLCSGLPEDFKTSLISIVQPFGSVLISVLKMAVFPIVLFSLIFGAASLPLKKSGKLGLSVVGWYFFTSLFATGFGIALALCLNPTMNSFDEISSNFQNGVSAFQSTPEASHGLEAFIAGLFKNPFEALADGQFLPIVVFSIITGLAARYILDSDKTPDSERQNVNLALSLCQGCQSISFRIVDWSMEYFPIGVFALSFVNFANCGLELFVPYLQIIVCVVIGVLGMILAIYPLALFLFCRDNPYRVLLRLRLPILTAFTTRSSAATLSVSMQTANKIGVSSSLSSFSLPLGCTINMDGVCVHLPVFVILASNIFNVPITPSTLLVLLVSVVFASIGAGGIPGGSVFLLFMILENGGFTQMQVATIVGLALGINPILDMFETACNVTGDNICTYIIAKRNGMLERKDDASENQNP